MARVDLPPSSRVSDAVFARHEREAKDWRRPHLGASIIGDEKCGRALWYSFRWVQARSFDGRMLRLFARGQREEDWVVEELRAIGVTVYDRDQSLPMDADGNRPQIRVSWHGGHFGGSCDGVAVGVPGASKTPHVLEVKTANKRRFDTLLKSGVRTAMGDHYAQMQTYMVGLSLDRALYWCTCKDDDRVYIERVRLDVKYADSVISRAEGVVFAPEPLSRVSEDPSWWECKFCDYRDVCHLGHVDKLERNCRTCASSTPMPDGSWHCSHHDRSLSVDDQRDGCAAHLLIPALLPWDAVDTGEGWVEYRDLDGKTHFDSKGRLS